MLKLEELIPGIGVSGVLPDETVTVVSVQWRGAEALTLVCRDASGEVLERLLYRDDEKRLSAVPQEQTVTFDGDGRLFRLVAEAHRMRLAHLFDPLLAVHTSLVEPLPHQITAVYEAMLPRQPLRFLLADDPGAGKTIMTGLLIRELILRGDLERCLIVCPGNLVEQWQDELSHRFHLTFEILTSDKLATAPTGNWFLEHHLVIARLDKLARDMEAQKKLQVPENRYDLVVIDEAHKLSAGFFGNDIRYTKRYHVGRLLAGMTRHFLLLTATPHNGRETDFQLFLALLDPDRFEGRFRMGVHRVDTSDLMRRVVKEDMVTFEGHPLFPERIAHTVPYRLSDEEWQLYREVTDYVRQEWGRADALADQHRARTVGFALMTLQRRLASSPEAIYQSLRRRRERLEKRLQEMKTAPWETALPGHLLPDREKLEELEEQGDIPEDELTTMEEMVVDQATAASTLEELGREIGTLRELETLAARVRRSGTDAKWCQLSGLLEEIFTPPGGGLTPEGTGDKASCPPKLVVFTEHRDTLHYLQSRIEDRFGRAGAVVSIHGGMRREERLRTQARFLHDPEVCVLLATDAAGEGINLQRAHLMVNYDLPWNPNRLEQRFGRIHRIGQTKVCHLWNLVAAGTREGDVYRQLLEKLEEARQSLGGKVFDVLGKLQFENLPLRQLMIEAVRYGDRPEVRERLNRMVARTVNHTHLQELLKERGLAQETMDPGRVSQVREHMERAAIHRLQPHYVESFFLEAFRCLGGKYSEREPRRYEITWVPEKLRRRRTAVGIPVMERYERVVFDKFVFDKSGVMLTEAPPATLVGPGHPLLEVVSDAVFEQYSGLLKRGTVLVDERDEGLSPRILFFFEHSIQGVSRLDARQRRAISRRLFYVEINADGDIRHVSGAPYLDYRPLRDSEPSGEEILRCPECRWMTETLEAQGQDDVIARLVPGHVQEVSGRRLHQIENIRAAVRERLTREIAWWDHQAVKAADETLSGKSEAQCSPAEARRRADELQFRLERRMRELDDESRMSVLPPVVVGRAAVIPIGLLSRLTGQASPSGMMGGDKQAIAARARAIVMETERQMGFEPIDREFEHLGYDIESRNPKTGAWRLLEVKARISGAATVAITRNEILTSLNHSENFILAMVEFLENGTYHVYYLPNPFQREPDFGVTSVHYDLATLLARAEKVR